MYNLYLPGIPQQYDGVDAHEEYWYGGFDEPTLPAVEL
jgi:hypothetical protein